jgi:hypothetical protein
MNPASKPGPHGTAERQEQKDLTQRVGTRLLPLSKKPSNLKWGTWKARVSPSREGSGE